MEIINKILWSIATSMLIVRGLYFGYKLNFLHLNIFKIHKILNKKNKKDNGISAFESLSVSLGACIGVGSLSGIALSIYKGGIGTIFWLLLSSLIIIPNSIVENILAVIYHEKKKSLYIGGPASYIKNGLGYKNLALIYAFIIVIAYLFGFLPIQSNTISKSITTFFPISPLLIGLIIGLISFIIINNGLKGIAKFSSFFVPFMGLIYLLASIFIIFKNINLLPNIFINIFKDAFNFNTLKYGLLGTIIIGIQRGIFASEIGAGTSAIASASSNETPIKQGIISMLGSYYTIFIICLSTALIILTSDYNPVYYSAVNGIEITMNALTYHLGSFGNIILYFCLIAFSFSTIISGYFYVETNLSFVFKKLSDNLILFLKIMTCIILVIATIINPTFIWNLADILTAFLVIINVYSIYKLKKSAIMEYRNEE